MITPQTPHDGEMRVHAATLSVYPFLLMVLAVLWTHPLYLAVLLAVVLAALKLRGALGLFARTMRYAIWILLLILVINVLIDKNGATVLIRGTTDWPLFGKLRVTLESMVYAGMLALRLVIILAASTLYIRSLSGDRALGLFAAWAKRSAVTAMLTARLIPYLSDQANAVSDVMRTRGVRLKRGNWLARIKARSPMLNVMLISSLEGSWQVAEAMEARGFGMGRRTAYSREIWSRTDFWLSAAMIGSLVLALFAQLDGWTAYKFYPRLATELPSLTVLGAAGIGLLLILPPLVMKRRQN